MINKKENRIDWQKEFDELFVDPIKYEGGYYWWKQKKMAEPKVVKQFIRKLLKNNETKT